MTMAASRKRSAALDDPTPLRAILDSLTKPDVSADREPKKAYAERLSRRLAVLLATALRGEFPQGLSREDDTGHESTTGISEGGELGGRC